MADMEFRPKSHAEQRIEARYGRPLGELLHDLYHGQKLSQATIAETIGVSRSTVVEWMQRYAIATGYNRSEAIA